jgi:hypothetical protein
MSITGGRRRTLTAACGYSIAGHPTEVNSLFRRHQRYCSACTGHTMPDFNATAAKGNGWDGLGKKHHLISRYEATTAITLQGTKYNGNLVTNGHALPTVDNLSLDDVVAFIETPQRENKEKKDSKKKKTKKPLVVVSSSL